MERQLNENNNHRVVSESRLRVRYAETDQMGVVYHSNHFIWFEVGRVDLLRQLGFSYREMEHECKCHLAVVDARCRYRAPATYDDEIIVRTYIKRVRGSLVHFGYELLRGGEGDLIAEGETTHIFIDAHKKITPFPEKYLLALRTAVANSEPETRNTKL
jgi:acyl-CoA thioester hydrolase